MEVKIMSMDLIERSGAQMRLKCLNNLGVTLFLPPPGGAQQAVNTQSDTSMKRNFVQIVESSLIDDLSEQFVGRLCEIFLKGGHVDIVHEEDHFLASNRTDLCSSFLGEFVLVEQDVQQVLGAGLS
jgi:hypothetical protein